MTTTAVVQIGNSDDKLTQAEWRDFWVETDASVRPTGRVHFAGTSSATAPWQNAAWVVELANDEMGSWLERRLADLAAKYRQNSIAMTVGHTKFVVPEGEA